MMDGSYSLDELLKIGTRKGDVDKSVSAISATDINRTLPFAVSEEMKSQIPGFSEEQLRQIGERKFNSPAMQPSEINNPRIEKPSGLDSVLEGLQNFLGIRTR